MAFKITFTDNSLKVISDLDNCLSIALEDAAAEIESAVKRNTSVGKVYGGNTRGKWQHMVDDATYTAVIGNSEETAIWLEFGTGEYALEGNGRKGGWYIPIGSGNNEISEAVADAYNMKIVEGKDGKRFVHTYGMQPQRPLQKAFDSNKKKVIKHLEDSLKGL